MDPDPGGQKTCRSGGSGSATLLFRLDPVKPVSGFATCTLESFNFIEYTKTAKKSQT